jgi:hypothetical protein
MKICGSFNLKDNWCQKFWQGFETADNETETNFYQNFPNKRLSAVFLAAAE